MKYMGSKNKHAKHILPFIYEAIKEINAKAYVEPFVGGGNMIDKVEVSIPKIANDSHYYLIEMFKALQKGWLPPDLITEEDYELIKNNKDDIDACLVGYVGFALSFGGKWWGGYRRDVAGTKGDIENMKLQSIRSLSSLKEQAEKLKDVQFHQGSFIDLEIPDKSVIYADPPYRDTTKYKAQFNHDIFWEWAEIMADMGHKIFVSEYTAPENWRCVWQKDVASSLTKDTGSKMAVEKLFTL